MTKPGAKVKVKYVMMENDRFVSGPGGLLSVKSHRLLLTSYRDPILGSPRWLGNPAVRLMTSDVKEMVVNIVLT